MLIELTEKQRETLLRLAEAEIRELSLEIHHTRTYKDPLKEQKIELRELSRVLGGTATDPAKEEPAAVI